MASVKLYLDKRRKGDGEACPLKIKVSQRSGACYISLGIKVEPRHFNEAAGKVAGGPNCKPMNVVIQNKMLCAQRAVLGLTDSGEVDGMTAAEIKERILRAMGVPAAADAGGGGFAAFFRDQAGSKPKQRTRDIYGGTLKAIGRFTDAEALTFEDITPKWLEEFDGFMARTSPAANARAIHLRNIRAVVNAAIDEGLTANYPFRKFKIRHEPTRKRSLSVEEMREVVFADIGHPSLAYFRDMFVLSFLLVGINTVDMHALAAVGRDGRIAYTRSKTGRKYDIRVEPEAAAIMARHRGKSRLLDMADRFGDDHAGFTSVCDKYLKRLRPRLSMYWARHTWATLAADLDIPIETIAAALGHSMGNATTAIYINFNRRKIDEANRRVIDYVYGKGARGAQQKTSPADRRGAGEGL